MAYEPEVYIIPANVSHAGKILGGMIEIRNMVEAINHVYVPRRWAGDIKKHLPSNLRPKVRIDRIFYTPLSDWKRNPLRNSL